MSSADDAREALEAALHRLGVPAPGVRVVLGLADAYARTAADAVTDAAEAPADPAAAAAPPTAPAAWGPGFVHLAIDGGIACNNRAPIPASRITRDPRGVSCTICRNSRKFKAVA